MRFSLLFAAGCQSASGLSGSSQDQVRALDLDFTMEASSLKALSTEEVLEKALQFGIDVSEEEAKRFRGKFELTLMHTFFIYIKFAC